MGVLVILNALTDAYVRVHIRRRMVSGELSRNATDSFLQLDLARLPVDARVRKVRRARSRQRLDGRTRYV